MHVGSDIVWKDVVGVDKRDIVLLGVEKTVPADKDRGVAVNYIGLKAIKVFFDFAVGDRGNVPAVFVKKAEEFESGSCFFVDLVWKKTKLRRL